MPCAAENGYVARLEFRASGASLELEDLFTDIDLRTRSVQMLNLTLNASTWPKWSDALELEKMQIVAMVATGDLLNF